MTGATGAGYASVLLDVPIAPAFDYMVPAALKGAIAPGDWVLVPWARQRRVGIVTALGDAPQVAADRVRELTARVDDAPRLDARWLALGEFAAGYYHCQPGELLIPAIPKRLRQPSAQTGEPAPAPSGRRRARQGVFEAARRRHGQLEPAGAPAAAGPSLTADQSAALAALREDSGYRCSLLHGVTGSGKTEVYLNWLAGMLAADPCSQVLLLVPEIALTPHLAAQVRTRLGERVAILHSAMNETARAAHWLAAAEGSARVVIGTRLAVLAPIPRLAAIVVDEEHDPSFKQQEHPHYSARDLAVARAHAAGIPIVLGSATPSLESWHAARRGRYRLLSLPRRATGVEMPEIDVIALHDRRDSDEAPEGLMPAAFQAMREAIAERAQTLVFLNRRGFAPVLSCPHCGWLSQCDDCSAYRVLHREGPRGGRHGGFLLICHHCASTTPVPARCPACGDPGLLPLGRGTQRIEDLLQEALPEARIARLDRDVARRVGATEAVFEALHAGDIDIVIGTQMLAKGHDVRRLALVIVLDPDGALFSSDFRGPERLFATLTQVAGRAGRHVGHGKVIVQTRFAGHPVFEALVRHDYVPFADRLLEERREASLPPYTHQAMLRAQAAAMPQALAFLATARRTAVGLLDAARADEDAPVVYDPVPMPMARVAGVNRAQLLVESSSRPALHRFLREWRRALPAPTARLRWHLEVDPVEI